MTMGARANLYASETYVDAMAGHMIGESGWQETFTDSPGELFRCLRGEYGLCTGRMYVDAKTGGAVQIGWVFQKRVRYEDSHETYIREVWVEVSTTKPERVCTMRNVSSPWDRRKAA